MQTVQAGPSRVTGTPGAPAPSISKALQGGKPVDLEENVLRAWLLCLQVAWGASRDLCAGFRVCCQDRTQGMMLYTTHTPLLPHCQPLRSEGPGLHYSLGVPGHVEASLPLSAVFLLSFNPTLDHAIHWGCLPSWGGREKSPFSGYLTVGDGALLCTQIGCV